MKRGLDNNSATIVENMNECNNISTTRPYWPWHAFPFLFHDSTLDLPRASFVLYYPPRPPTNMDPPETQQRLGAHRHSMPFLERAPASNLPSDPPQSLGMACYCSYLGFMLRRPHGSGRDEVVERRSGAPAVVCRGYGQSGRARHGDLPRLAFPYSVWKEKHQ